MIELLLAAMLAIGADAPQAVSNAQPPAKAKAAKPKKDQAEKPKKEKKPKKAKASKPKVASPDEPLDVVDSVDSVDSDANGTQIPAPGVAPRHFVWKQHPSVRFGKVFRLDFQAKFQEDGRSSYEGSEQITKLDPWELHRSRIGVQGTAFRKIEFEIERELTEKELTEKEIAAGITPQSHWKDVNVNVGYIDNAQVQVGKFKVPFGLDQLTGVTQNDFVYRSLGANYLAPARDIGVMVHGRFFKRGLSYWSGVFRHDGDNARSKKIQGGDATFATRISGAPFRHASALLEGLEVGGAVAVTHVSDDSFRPNGLRGRTVLTQDYFFEPVFVKGTRTRTEFDVDWMKGPGSIRAEYTHVRDPRQNQGFGDEDLPTARYRSWYVAGTWLLTGETKTRPVKPALDLFGGGFGAVEVVGRFERIWIDSVVKEDEPFANPRAFNMLPTGDKALTVGVNWSVNRFVKLQVNAIREQVEDPGRSPVPNGASFWSRVFRLQLVL